MRKLSMLIGLGVCLLATPRVAAQGTPPPAVAPCLTCHGPAMDGADAAPGGPAIPRLGGQHPDYLEKQLREYKSGKRKNDLMSGLLASVSRRQIADMAAHFSAETPVRRPTTNAELAARGRTLFEDGNAASGVPGCIGCHLDGGVGAPRYPRLAGQRQSYLVQELTSFKTGTRMNDRARVMREIARKLTDDEIRAVAEYLAGL